MPFSASEGRNILADIVVDSAATPQEKYAASELRDYLMKSTLLVFAVVPSPTREKAFYIGRAARPFIGEETFSDDGFLVRVTERAVCIDGGKRGVIYGVYELLERMGFRFFTPDCEKIPAFESLKIPEMSLRQEPQLEYRDHNYYFYATHPRFAVKCRLNGQYAPVPEAMGGHMSYTGFVHTFNQLIDPERYGKEHPEYFGLYNGKRVIDAGFTQPCLTHPDVLEIVTDSVRKLLVKNPDTRLLSISQNDYLPGCQCEACRASDAEEGSPAGTLIRFVNRVAERLEAEYPQVIFDTLAYNYTRPVPKITRPRRNVCVRLCSIECCFSHPMGSCEQDRSVSLPDGGKTSFVQDLNAWGRTHDWLYIWDYTTCFAHYPAPFPNWRVLQPNMRLFVKNNVKGVFEQANSGKKGGVDLNEMRAYILSKLLWDADCDVRKHMREFAEAYYGPAAPYILAFIDCLCDKAENDRIHVGFNDSTDTPLYSDEMLDRLEGFLLEGAKSVQGDALRLWRVEKARLGVRYVRIKNGAMLKNSLDADAVRTFFDDWKSFGMGRIDEWVSPETTLRALLENKWRGTEYYHHFAEEGPEIY